MWSLLLPVTYILLLWWLLTGVVLYLDGLPRRSFRWTLLGATVVLLLAVLGVVGTRSSTSLPDVYCAATCGLLIWGYLELTYLTGFFTGPVKHACPPRATGPRRFWLALQTSLYHELAVVFAGLMLYVITAGHENHFAFGCFVVLWIMRWSAKLNLYFGVRNLNEDWLPEHLRYLASYMRRRPIGPFFLSSVGAAMAMAIYLTSQFSAEPLNGQAAGQLLVLTLLWLAILEHWMLVLPVDASAVWRWGLRSHDRAQTGQETHD